MGPPWILGYAKVGYEAEKRLFVNGDYCITYLCVSELCALKNYVIWIESAVSLLV